MSSKRTEAQWGAVRFQTVAGVRTVGSILLLIFGWPSLEDSSVFAQATTAITHTTGIGDLGTRTISQGQTIQIIGGTRSDQGRETNLFHSFDQFSVGDGHTAQFLNTTPSLRTDNILSRVTGGDHSSIFGTIDTTSYPGANLFLMNPAGVVVGPNATIHVGGSVAFTTADYLRFAQANGTNAGIFRADPRTTPQLSSAPIAAFGFLGKNQAAIEVNGATLALDPGQSLSLVGGNVTIQSTRLVDKADPPAPGNQVFVASVASPGEILTGTLASAANINEIFLETLGTVHISEGSTIDTSNRDGGTIRIRGGQLIVDGSNIFAGSGGISLDGTSILIKNSARIGTYTITTANAGNVVFEASRDIELDSNTLVESQTFSASRDAGNVTFRSGQGNIALSNKSNLTTQAFDGGRNTGSIEIDAKNGNVRLDNSRIFPSATQGSGTMGGVKITANNLELGQGARIDSDNTTAQVADPIDIQVRGLLRLTGKSEIETTAIGRAPAADLIVKASDIQLLEESKFSVDTTSSSSGAGGDVIIQGNAGASNLVTINGPGSGIFTSTEGTGPAGNIDVKATSVTLQNNGKISAESTGNSSTAIGGSIIVQATDRVTLTNGGTISSGSAGPGNAGNIFINAGQQLEVRDSPNAITTGAAKASGGNIDIRAIDRIRFVNSSISTSVLSADGKGGNIFIDPNVVILEGSNVTANAVGGPGGNITFVTPLFLADSASTVSASSERGPSGTVNIQSPIANLIGTVGQLASKTSPPQVLLQNRCVALAGGEQSTFILTGRNTLPVEPGGWLSSPVSMEHWTGVSPEHVSTLMVQSPSRRSKTWPAIITPKGEVNVLSLRRLTPPGFLVRAFATPSTGCPS